MYFCQGKAKWVKWNGQWQFLSLIPCRCSNDSLWKLDVAHLIHLWSFIPEAESVPAGCSLDSHQLIHAHISTRGLWRTHLCPHACLWRSVWREATQTRGEDGNCTQEDVWLQGPSGRTFFSPSHNWAPLWKKHKLCSWLQLTISEYKNVI